MNHATDAELVAAYVAGRSDAFADIYDRYADQLYDTAAAMLRDREEAADAVQDVFVLAASKLPQLRDHDRLKPWLFAILRNDVYRRTKRRSRTIATDFSAPGADMAALDQDVEGRTVDQIQGAELTELVRAAAQGLDDRDREVLELSARQGLQGTDLADALGVSAQQSYGLVHRMRERAERSLTAYCVARAGRRDCPELDTLLTSWDGEFSVLVRKRVARHIDRCETCERSRRVLAPVTVFSAAPVLVAPAALRDRVLAAVNSGPTPGIDTDTLASAPDASSDARAHPEHSSIRFRSDGFPVPPDRSLRRSPILIAGAAAVVLVLAATLALLAGALPFGGGDDQVAMDPAVVDADQTSLDDGVGPVTSDNGINGDGDGLGNDPVSDPSNPGAPGDDTPANGDLDGTGDGTGDDGTGDNDAGGSNQSGDAIGGATSSGGATGGGNPVTGSPGPAAGGASGGAPVAEPSPTTTVVPAPAPTPAPPTTEPPATPGELVGDVTSLDFGQALTQHTLVLSNPGGTAVAWEIGDVAPFAAVPSAGTLEPGGTAEVVVSIDRAPLAEGDHAAVATVSAPGVAPHVVSLTAAVRRAPVVTPIDTPPSLVCAGTTFATVQVTADVEDESPVTVVLRWTGPNGAQGSTPMSGTPWEGSFNATPNAFGGPATWTWTVEATDSFGSVGQATGSFVAAGC